MSTPSRCTRLPVFPHSVGHSNGTYLLANALHNYRGCQSFDRVVACGQRRTHGLRLVNENLALPGGRGDELRCYLGLGRRALPRRS